NPTTGRPTYVAGPAAPGAPPSGAIVVDPFGSVWIGAETLSGKNPRSSQPCSNVVGMFATFAEPSTFELLNVITFASQQIEFVSVGGGGEKSSGVDVVFSSRS